MAWLRPARQPHRIAPQRSCALTAGLYIWDSMGADTAAMTRARYSCAITTLFLPCTLA